MYTAQTVLNITFASHHNVLSGKQKNTLFEQVK